MRDKERKISKEVRDEVSGIFGIGIRELGKLESLPQRGSQTFVRRKMLQSFKKVTKKNVFPLSLLPQAIFPGCGTDVCATICSNQCGVYGSLDWHTAMHWATTWI